METDKRHKVDKTLCLKIAPFDMSIWGWIFPLWLSDEDLTSCLSCCSVSGFSFPLKHEPQQTSAVYCDPLSAVYFSFRLQTTFLSLPNSTLTCGPSLCARLTDRGEKESWTGPSIKGILGCFYILEHYFWCFSVTWQLSVVNIPTSCRLNNYKMASSMKSAQFFLLLFDV